jgi:hypothetical protein
MWLHYKSAISFHRLGAALLPLYQISSSSISIPSRFARCLASESLPVTSRNLLQIATEKPTPVHSVSVPDVWFWESLSPLIGGIADDYIIQYTAFVCRKRETDIKLLICTQDEVEAHINGKKVSPCVLPSIAKDSANGRGTRELATACGPLMTGHQFLGHTR